VRRRPLVFGQVDRSLRAVESQLRSALRIVNQQAAKLVGKGKYEEADETVGLARSALRFQDRFESVVAEWHEVSGKSARKGQPKVPLWRYYVVVARSLARLGGEATIRDVVANIEATASAEPASQENPSVLFGNADWKRAVEKARAPMRQHGYVELIGQGRWRLTKLGRELADRSEA
jgi:hypothetical protein